MLFKQRQREMGAVDLHPDLQTSNCGLKSTSRVLSVTSKSLLYVL